MNAFSELSLSPLLQNNLIAQEFRQPTPVQQQAIPAVLTGRDAVVTAQTGTGKTLAFLLPIIQSLLQQTDAAPGIRSLILTPTRELAIQIADEFSKLAQGTSLRAAVVVGGMSEQNQLHAIRRGVQVVIATPGRLADYLNRRLVKLETVSMLVLDEADRMLDMGFLPTITKIMTVLPKQRQTMCFSATMESSVAKLTQSYLKNPVRVAIGSTTKPAEEITLHYYEVEQDCKLSLLKQMLEEQSGSFLVFARTKHGADRLAKRLARGGSTATAIHGNRSQSQRNRALRGFQEGEYRVLVATDVAARGIHVEGIAHVVNYDLPQAPEDFIHRAGRTGRAGRSGIASTFGTRSERTEIGRIEKLINARMIRRDVSANLQRETRSTEAPAESQPANNRHRQAPAQPRAAARPSVRRWGRRFGRRSRVA